MVVIYPQWIVDVMACLVTVQQGAVKVGLVFFLLNRQFNVNCLLMAYTVTIEHR